jgi:peptidyl-prolyl cis-trans isomerase D
MLQAIREKAHGWIAWVFVILISVPFALWGIQEYLGGGSDASVAEVAGQEISKQALEESTRNYREQLRANLGAAYRAELFGEQMLRRQVLDRMIDERVLQSTARDWGMRASDQMVVDAIAAERAFQSNGRFDHALYQTVLRNNGLTESGYEASIRQGLALEQFQGGVTSTAFATKAELGSYQRLLQQQRTLAYAVVQADRFLDKVEPDEAAIKAYYDSHQREFQIPERVKVDYLMLDVAGLAQGVAVTDSELADYFEQHQDAFLAPEERRLRHILIPIEGDEAAALSKAEELRGRLSAGADFPALAKAESADPGSAPNGGDLGWVSRGMMVDAFEQAAFALAEGAISEPVKSPFGFHLIQLQAVRGGGEATLDQVYDEVSAAYRKAEVERDFFEKAERLAELAYENPDNLTAAADTLGLTIRHSDWFTRSGSQGELASPKVTAAAFSDDVLQQGNNSELLELGPEKLLVLRVSDHQESRIQALDEIREQVTTAVRQELAAEQARLAGERGLQRLQDGADLVDLAIARRWEIKSPKSVGRADRDVPASLRELAFRLPRPEGGSPVVAGTSLANGDYALLALTKVQDGDVAALDDAARQVLVGRIAAMNGRLQLDATVQALREQADVSISLTTISDDE